MNNSSHSTISKINPTKTDDRNKKETQSNEEINESLKSYETREIETLTDICSSDNIAEVDVISLLDENLPQYKLRADNIFSHSNCDWIRAPLYIDENEISELTNEQIGFTLDYFIQSGYRVSQMTKTYYDIEAVTRLLDEKERDLELAATIGKQLLEKDQKLEEKIEFLEEELVKTNDMVNQLRYEIQIKDNLLKSFIESEQDCNIEENSVDFLKSSNNHHTKRVNEINIDTLNEYKLKIEYLEEENEQLKYKADFYEKETADLELKESNLIENCFRELEESQETLRHTQNELKNKTTECYSQQEEINNLFGQIFELQVRIKCLTKDNLELQSIYETSKADLVEQIREFKDKYNECVQMLNKSQEEISILRRKASRRKSNLNFSIGTSSNVDSHALESFYMLKDDSDDLDSSFIFKPKNKIFSPFVSSNQSINNSSFAAEVFSTISRNHRENFLSQKISQSNNLIKKVKQKMIKSIPGTSTSESCFQSEDENIVMNHLDMEKKIMNCPTPDSTFSTGSNSIYSNFWRSNSFIHPEKLQIVKPIEGSYTLQHWQNLATPSFGCLFENRPGISIKGNSSETESDTKEDDRDSLLDELEFIKDDLDYFEISNQDLDSEYQNRVLSPSKIEILTKLLENEEVQDNIQVDKLNEHEEELQENASFFGKVKTILFKPIRDKQTLKGEFSDPDTPPSSPTNFENNNSFAKIINSISNYFKNPPTPPGSPVNELVDEELSQKIENKSNFGFFDQIVHKLKGFNQIILKNDKDASEEVSEMGKNLTQNKCKTPPPSPSRLSPPTPDLEDLNYNEDDLKKSAFVTVTKLNPLLNHQVDLSSLLRSLSLLKRNQR